eukprot:GHRQ01035648.1.p1 GENE.GHRQ01035648.1~~GHRQ01035648.1.p1  ORF type:complete len:156 (+),score=26.63 GHRQ01035648.1:129-596(+)
MLLPIPLATMLPLCQVLTCHVASEHACSQLGGPCCCLWRLQRPSVHYYAAAPAAATAAAAALQGVCLQGRFHTSEPLSSIFMWLTDSLTDPATTYELIGPDRRPLPSAGRVAQAQLAPAALLNFRLLGQQRRPVDAAGRQRSFLKDELLQRAYAD